MSRRIHFLAWLAPLVIALLACGESALAAQAGAAVPATQTSRPMVGLALSGGGARGAAHIGVLKVLEENRIPIDYIAGTSMGSIVGGLYATGMTPDEIAEAIQSIDWNGVFQDLTERQERSFRRKRDDDLYLVKARPGVSKDGLKFPAGVIQGQKINMALTRFTRHAAQIDNFDDFVIPFRAVATDIVTGEAVVLEKGNLAHSIRASMSVPAAFSPMVIDGRKLVDGGVSNNLPIDVVRAMGADVVIAVDISTPLLPDDKVNSVLAITTQLTGILTRRNSDYQVTTLTDDDVLLVPDLGDITTADFDRAVEAITPGRAAAEASIDKIRRYALEPQAYAAYRSGQKAIGRATPVVNFIRLDNQSHVKDSMLAYRVHDSQIGEPLSHEAVERDVGRIYGLELFQSVGYDVVEENGETGLEFYVKEREWGPTYLQVGASYDANTDGDNVFNLAVSTIHTGLNASRGELRLGVQIGEEPGFLADYHQPFGDLGMWFANVQARLGDRLVTIFDNDEALADLEIGETSIAGSIGREFGTWSELRAGVRYSDGDATVRIGDPGTFPPIEFQSGEFFVQFFADEFDSFYFPRSGYLVRAEWAASRGGLGADAKFDQIDLDAAIAKSWGKHTVIGGVSYHSTISGTAPVQSVIRAGGFLNLSGFNANELSGQHYGHAILAYYRRLGHSKFLPLYAGASAEAGNVFQNRDDIGLSDLLYAGSLWLGADTPLGPLYVAYGHAEGGANAFYIFLGRAF